MSPTVNRECNRFVTTFHDNSLREECYVGYIRYRTGDNTFDTSSTMTSMASIYHHSTMKFETSVVA